MINRYEEQIYLSLVAGQCNRFDHMFKYMEEMVKKKKEELTSDERNLFYAACKNNITHERESILTLLEYEAKESKKAQSDYLNYIKEYRDKYQKKLEEKCQKVIELIESKLLYNVSNKEGKVFYQKMKGDFYRYMAEYADIESKDKFSKKCLEEYNQAVDGAQELEWRNPIKLGLMLNFAMFSYEIVGDKEEGIKMTKKAIEEGKKSLVPFEGDAEWDLVDARKLISTMESNLDVWTEEKNED